jgi:dihydroxy-acid dehydratase
MTEAPGMSLPGSAAIPAPYRDRQEAAWRIGTRIVDIVREDRKPSDIPTKQAFHTAIRVNSAISGSTNGPAHSPDKGSAARQLLRRRGHFTSP